MNADNRKGELAELKGQLRQLAGSRAPGVEDLKRELYKKVISYLTVGIDVSSLFSEMVMCSATSDLVLKKMCYLYVGNYARGYPELALLTINFLQKDCQDDDPMIRGLALRSLCSLRVKNLVEYLVGPLQRGLKDSNGYVRSVAAIGVLKLYHIAPSSCTDNDFPVTLKALLLHDSDPQVVANCLCSLLEILSIEGNVSEAALREKESLLHRNVILSLLNRFKEFSEWAQCLVLEVVSKYVPEDAQETHDMMDVLDDRLQHANSAVVLATIKVFLHLTMSMADVHQKVYERIKAPLLTLVSSGSAEQSYAVLSHLHLLVMRAPMLFASDYKHFYCRYSDPSYVKKLKLEMLTAVANESNTYEIGYALDQYVKFLEFVNSSKISVVVPRTLLDSLQDLVGGPVPLTVTELSEYAANVDVAIARESIRAVGKIALQQYDVNAIVDRLLQFLEMEKDYVTAETLVLVKDLLRKYPQWSHDCIAVVGNVSSKSVTEPKAKAALVWMLGEYAYDMSDAPYVLEGFVQSWAEEDFAEVRLELLTAVAKCFFKRPPETVQILGAALSFGFADANQDVHDRALLYYRLLQHSVEVAERVINPPKQAVSVFAGDQSSEIKDRIFDEFNSLAVVYRQPSYMFLDKDQRSPFAFSEDTGSSIIGPQSPGREDLPSDIDARDNDLLLSAHEKEDSRAVSNGSHGYSSSKFHTLQEFTDSAFAPRSPSPTQPIRNARATPLPPAAVSSTAASPLLAVDDLLGLGPSASAEPFPPLKLNPKPVLDPASFKRKWGQLTVALTLEYTFPAQAMVGLTGPQPLVRHMQTNSVQCMASGNAPLKFFFFAQLADAPANTGFFLVELVVTTSSGLASAKIKADDSSLAPAFADSLQSALSKFGSL